MEARTSFPHTSTSGVIRVKAIYFVQKRAIGSTPLIGQLNATRTRRRVSFQVMEQ